MNGFTLMADSLRKAAGEGTITTVEAEKKARVYDFLATCDTDDIYTLFDSTAFNEIAKDYMRAAEYDLIMNRYKFLLSEMKLDDFIGCVVEDSYKLGYIKACAEAGVEIPQ